MSNSFGSPNSKSDENYSSFVNRTSCVSNFFDVLDPFPPLAVDPWGMFGGESGEGVPFPDVGMFDQFGPANIDGIGGASDHLDEQVIDAEPVSMIYPDGHGVNITGLNVEPNGIPVAATPISKVQPPNEPNTVSVESAFPSPNTIPIAATPVSTVQPPNEPSVINADSLGTTGLTRPAVPNSVIHPETRRGRPRGRPRGRTMTPRNIAERPRPSATCIPTASRPPSTVEPPNEPNVNNGQESSGEIGPTGPAIIDTVPISMIHPEARRGRNMTARNIAESIPHHTNIPIAAQPISVVPPPENEIIEENTAASERKIPPRSWTENWVCMPRITPKRTDNYYFHKTKKHLKFRSLVSVLKYEENGELPGDLPKKSLRMEGIPAPRKRKAPKQPSDAPSSSSSNKGAGNKGKGKAVEINENTEEKNQARAQAQVQAPAPAPAPASTMKGKMQEDIKSRSDAGPSNNPSGESSSSVETESDEIFADLEELRMNDLKQYSRTSEYAEEFGSCINKSDKDD